MTDQEIQSLLKNAKTIAVVGFSSQAHKPSFFVAKYLQSAGYRILPVNPLLVGKPSGLLGEVVYPSVKAAADKTGLKIDLVDVFRRPEHTPEVFKDAVSAGAAAIWLQEGIENQQVAELAQKINMPCVMNRCTKVEHQRMTLGL